MARIVELVYYEGARERVERLGLAPLLNEIIEAIERLPLQRFEKKDGAAVRKIIDAQFLAAGGWTKRVSGDLDWVKCKVANGTRVCIGVEVQFSARSDLIMVDMIHLNKAFREGHIDVGVILLPGYRISDAKRHVDTARLQDSPLIVLAVEHDGPGPALLKQLKRAHKP